MQSLAQHGKIHAFIFDLDGVLTETQEEHLKAWKHMFNQYLKERAKLTNTEYKPFEDSDYHNYVDGKPRYDGVRDFLKSRNISIPEGNEGDTPNMETVHGLGNRKDEYFEKILNEDGVKVYQSSIDFVRDIRKSGIKTAVVSSSKNCGQVLGVSHIQDLFEVKVDGNDLTRLKIPGKPDPAMFLEAAKRLGVEPKEAAIVEDALAGVEAGRRGNFGLVVGMAHAGDDQELKKHGADIAVYDLRRLESAQKILG